MYKLMVTIFLSWISLSWAANHYVDKNVNGGNNNGTSWSNAWESFTDIEWNQIQPGDIIFISGGTDSTTYYESLTIGANGTAANLITVRKGLNAGHNGKVIIQGEAFPLTIPYTGTGISTVGHQYIRLVGLNSRGWQSGIVMHSSNVIYLDSCSVNACNWGVNVSLNGGGSDSIFVWNNHLTCFDTTPNQNDVIGGTGCTYLEVKNNYIYQGNRYSKNGHSDCMQFLYTGKQIYANNWIESVASGGDSSAASGLNGQWNLAADTTLMYNNVFIIRGYVRDVFMDRTPTGHTWLMYNNTFIKEYDNTPAQVVQTTHPETFAKNNIIYSTNSQFALVGLLNPLTNNSNFDYNFYYHPYYPNIVGYRTLAVWQSQGGGIHSIEGDPLFVNLNSPNTMDVRVQSGSPCIDAGTASIKTLVEAWGLTWESFNNPYIDWANGGARSETTPTIGAVEYGDRGPDITPPEVTGATLLDSVTLKIMFSEALDETTAEDRNNYSISNNIDIFNASLSGSEVTLQTSTHSPNSYIVTVVNVEDLAGNPISQSNTAEYSFPTVVDPIINGLPKEFSLNQNYPNPFNPTTTIRYSIPLEGLVTLKVYNTIGEEVIILANEVKQVGIYEVEFDASNLTSGIYFYKLRASDFVQVKKMILLK